MEQGGHQDKKRILGEITTGSVWVQGLGLAIDNTSMKIPWRGNDSLCQYS